MISFDEYGCNFSPQKQTTIGRCGAIDRSAYPEFSSHISRPFRFNDPDAAEPSAPGEFLEALALSSILMTLVRHADRVKIGCMTGGLFVIGSDEEHVWKRAGYYLFEQFIRHAKGISLRPAVESPVYSVKGFNLNDFNQTPAYDNVPFIECCASLDEENGKAAVFLINRNWEEDMEIELDISGFTDFHVEGHTVLHAENPHACNTCEDQKAVMPEEAADDRQENGKIYMKAPKLSLHVIYLTK